MNNDFDKMLNGIKKLSGEKTNVDILKENMPRVYSELIEYINANFHTPNYTPDERINEWSPKEVVEAWCNWNGIYGYHGTIIELMEILPTKEVKRKYKVTFSAEGATSGYIMLTDKEAEIIRKVTNTSNWDSICEDDPYSGSFYIELAE